MLETSRTYLKLLKESDFDDVLEMFAGEYIFKYIKPHKNKTKQDHIAFLNLKMNQIKSKSGFYWVVRSKQSNEFIGAINLTPIPKTDKIQIGWMIVLKHHQKGFAFESAEAVFKFALFETDFNPIYGVFEKENSASERILSKLGFTLNTSWFENEVEVCKYIFKK